MEEKDYYKIIYDDGDNEVVYFIYEDRVSFTTGDSGVDYELNGDYVVKELCDCFDHIMYRLTNKKEVKRVCKIILLILLFNRPFIIKQLYMYKDKYEKLIRILS